ncbi:MAG: M13 family metallopeptidase, partial [Acidobacteriota bacterium]|nr:M13 family metallopeptidase [Acidobacteriota bacterium]
MPRLRRFSERLTRPLLFGLLLLPGGLVSHPAAAAAPPANSSAPAGPTVHGFDPSHLDRSIRPCTDFYQFANGAWLAGNPIPSDRSSWGHSTVLAKRNLDILHQVLEAAAQGHGVRPGGAERKAGDFYRSGMDVAKIEAQGASPIAPELRRIATLSNPAGLLQEIARLHSSNVACEWNPNECTISTAFRFRIEQDFKQSTRVIVTLRQGGLGLPDRDDYTRQDETARNIRKQYQEHIARLLQLAGDEPAKAAAGAATALAIETRLAQASMTTTEQREPAAIYHKMRLAELDAFTPGLSWKPYFDALGLADPGDINVAQPRFFAELATMLSRLPLDDWKVYLRWHLVSDAAPKLSAAFVDEDWSFRGKVLEGAHAQAPRWQRILWHTDWYLPEALGQLYVDRAFGPEAKERALELVRNLRLALRERLAVLDWIGEETRRQALQKVDSLVVKIGYPDHWRDYSGLAVGRGSYFDDVVAAGSYEFARNLAKLGKPLDRGEWQMSPPTVNAYYDPSNNEIVFPAGILQPPFFDPAADDASNYGEMGSIIGHELTHGFDDQGRQFDASGNLREWWSPADIKRFDERAALVARQFDDFVAIGDTHVNGKLTLGEDIADLGGLRIAYAAFHKALAAHPQPEKIDGWTPEQRFFLAYAQLWANNIRPEALRTTLESDPHAPSHFRANAPLANSPEFARAFGCHEG